MVNVLQSMFSFFFLLLLCFVVFCVFCFFVFLLPVCCFFFNYLRCKKLYLRLNDNPLNPLSRKPTTFLSYFILFICFLNNIYVSV